MFQKLLAKMPGVTVVPEEVVPKENEATEKAAFTALPMGKHSHAPVRRFGVGLEEQQPTVNAFSEMFEVMPPDSVTGAPQVPLGPKVSVDPEMVKKLRVKVLSDEAGTIVNQLLETMDALRDDIPDNGRLFKAATRTLIKRGVSEAQVSNALSAVNEALNVHRQQFERALSTRKAGDSRASEERVREAQVKVLELEQSIRSLEHQKGQSETNLVNAQRELEQIEGRYATQEAQYEAASKLLSEEFSTMLRLAGANKEK